MSVGSSKASSVGVKRASLISVTDKRRLVSALAVARGVSIVFFDEVTSVAAVLDVCWISIVLNNIRKNFIKKVYLKFKRSISQSIIAAITRTVAEAVLEEVLTISSN